jgi:hypothetical protein
MTTPFAGLLEVIGGVVIIRFARSAYRRPDEYLARWFFGYIVPPFRWTTARLKGFAMFWIFGAVVMSSSGIFALVSFSPMSRTGLIVWIAACAGMTVVLIPRSSMSRHNTASRKSAPR